MTPEREKFIRDYIANRKSGDDCPHHLMLVDTLVEVDKLREENENWEDAAQQFAKQRDQLREENKLFATNLNIKYEEWVQLLKNQDLLKEKLAAAEKEREKWKREHDACLEHFKVVNEERHRLKNASTETVCAYCEIRFDEKGTELISEHVQKCEKHPLFKLKEKLAAAEKFIRYKTLCDKYIDDDDKIVHDDDCTKCRILKTIRGEPTT